MQRVFSFFIRIYICAGQQFLLQTLHIGVNGVCEQGMNDFSHQKERFHREVRET